MKILSKKSMTLTELLISVGLIGIVLIGIVSVEIGIRNTRNISTRVSDVTLRVSAAVIHVIRNAEQAIGQEGNAGIGTLSDATSEILWVRIDEKGTPTDYSDDTWYRTMFNRSTNKWVEVCGGVTGIGDTGACAGSPYTIIIADEVSMTWNPTEFYLEVTISAIYDASSAQHPTNNPKAIYAAKVFPMAHSW